MIPLPTIAFAGMGIVARSQSRANMTGADPEIEKGAAYSKVGIYNSAQVSVRLGVCFPNMRLFLRLGRYNQAKINGHWSLT